MKFGLKKFFETFGLPLLSALLLSLSFPKFELQILIFFALVPLFFSLKDEKSSAQIFQKVIFFGVLHYVILLYWIVYTLIKYGQIPLPVSIFLLLLLSAYLSLYWVLFFLLLNFLNLLGHPTFWKGFLASLIFVSIEFLRSVLLTGFPWGLIGYPLTNFPTLLQIADLLGIWGLSLVVFLINYFFYFVFERVGNYQHLRKGFYLDLLFFGVLIGAFLIYGQGSFNLWKRTLETSREVLRVSLLQGNIPQELKEARETEISLKTYENLTLQSLKDFPDLIVYPETALPFYFPYEKEPSLKFLATLEKVKAYSEDLKISPPAIIFGTFRVSFEKNPPLVHNSLLVWNGKEIEDLYDKEKLVPFGEYVPLAQYFPFLKKISVVSDIIKPGISKNLQFKLKEKKMEVLPLICFESAFPQILVKRLKSGGDLVVIATNDAWFDKTSAPYQHFQMAIVRAVEGRRFVLQAANTGITGIIDPLGRVIKKSDLEREEIVSGEIKLLHKKTPFVKIGYLFPIFSLFVTFLLLITKFYAYFILKAKYFRSKSLLEDQ